MQWMFDNPMKTIAACFVVAVLSLAWLGHVVSGEVYKAIDTYDRHEQTRKACEKQGGIYIDSQCKKPSEVVTPK